MQTDPEWEGRDDEQRQQDRPAEHRRGADRQDGDAGDDQAGEFQMVLADVPDVVPALARDQGKGQRAGEHQACNSQAGVGDEKGDGQGPRSAQAAGYLEGSAHWAPP